jgi:hypothetical protein
VHGGLGSSRVHPSGPANSGQWPHGEQGSFPASMALSVVAGQTRQLPSMRWGREESGRSTGVGGTSLRLAGSNGSLDRVLPWRHDLVEGAHRW